MKLVVLLAVVAVAVAVPRPDNHYDRNLENINLEEILENAKLLEAYANCLLGIGKCTPLGIDIKKLLPEATETSCAKCTDKQKAMVAKSIKTIQVKLPKKFEALMKQNDPELKRQDELKKFLDKYSA